MSEHYKTVLLFGPPGAGKGTQGKIIAQIPGFFHVSTGEIFRNLDVTSDVGKLFYQYSSRGELVPDDITIRIWSQHVYACTILGLYKPKQDIMILDGLPRSVNQATLLYRYIEPLMVIHLVVKEKEAMWERLRKRALKENRIDDAKEEVIRKRWDVYERETFPVLNFYPKAIVREVDAMGSPAAVLNKTLDCLVPVQNEHFKNPLGPGVAR